MTHIRTDNESTNDKRRFACGLGPDLPQEDTYFFVSEVELYRMVDCPKCKELFVQRELGTPISELSGRPGHKGYDKFRQIAESWGYD